MPDALRSVEVLTAIGVAIASLEVLYCRRQGSTPLIEWEITRTRHPHLSSGWSGRLYGYVANDRVAGLVHAARLGCCVVLVIGGMAPVLGVCALVACICSVIAAIRSPYGMDGSDQVVVLTLAATGLARLGGPLAAESALLFIAFQVGASYFIAGAAKLKSQSWRNGDALPALTATSIYGNRTVNACLSRHASLAKVLGRGITLWEVAFPVVFVVPAPVAASLLVSGFLFHAFCAAAMHLNSFVWAFVAAYPAIWYVSQHTFVFAN
jgi:hypothetical protein